MDTGRNRHQNIAYALHFCYKIVFLIQGIDLCVFSFISSLSDDNDKLYQTLMKDFLKKIFSTENPSLEVNFLFIFVAALICQLFKKFNFKNKLTFVFIMLYNGILKK